MYLNFFWTQPRISDLPFLQPTQSRRQLILIQREARGQNSRTKLALFLSNVPHFIRSSFIQTLNAARADLDRQRQELKQRYAKEHVVLKEQHKALLALLAEIPTIIPEKQDKVSLLEFC